MPESQKLTEVNIPVNLIDPPEFNSRIGYQADNLSKEDDAKLHDLARSMQPNGTPHQLQAVGVEPAANGRYLLVFGSRRLRAAKLNGWETIRATVNPPTSDVERILTNAKENLDREDLTTFEQARLCAALRVKGMKLKECATELGFSVPKVSNYAICYDKLPPDIKKAWQSSHPAASVEALREIATLGEVDKQTLLCTPESVALMEQAWAERLELQSQADALILGVEDDDDDEEEDDDEAGEDGAVKKKVKADFKVARALHKHVIDALRAKRSLPGASLAAQVADFLVGKVDKVKGLTSRKEFDEGLKPVK